MKQKLASLSLGVALAAAVAPPVALGGDAPPYGSSKDYGAAAVPVPAPVPVPIYNANWYFRIDGGVGLGSGGPGFSEHGIEYGLDDSPGTTGPEPFGTSSSWFNDDYPTFATVGGGVGFIWSKNVRTDVTLEARTGGRNIIDGETSYVVHDYDGSGNYGPVTDGSGNPMRQVNIYTTDVTEVAGGFMLFNAYYDFASYRGFTPYVGAGLGISFNELRRRHSTTETTCSLLTTPACQSESLRDEYSARETHHTITLAAMLTAGFSYDITDVTALDFNYRYLHLEGTSAPLVVNGANSRVNVGDTQEHQLRAGLRFNIN